MLANDTGLFFPSTLTIGSGPLHGTAVPDPVAGTVLYTPAFNFSGTDAFTYTVANGSAVSNAAIVSIAVNASPPVAVNDVATTDENLAVTIPVAANDTGALAVGTVAIAAAPLHGTAVPNPIPGAVLYTPAVNFFGTDTFTYTIGDGLGAVSAPATVTVTVFRLPGDRVQRYGDHAREHGGGDQRARQRHGTRQPGHRCDRRLAAPRDGGARTRDRRRDVYAGGELPAGRIPSPTSSRTTSASFPTSRS